MTTLENLEQRNQEIQTNPQDLTDQEVQQITFTPEMHGKSTETINTGELELLNDPTLKSGLNKIFEKEAESILSTFEKNNYEKTGGLAIENWGRLIEMKHPDMITFVYGELGLPYKRDIYLDPKQGTKFSELTFDQKMGFMCLKRTFDAYKGDIGNVSSEEFINKYKQIYSGTMDVVVNNFVETMKRNSLEVPTGFNFSEFKVEGEYYIKLKKFLKKNYGLTDDEISKIKDFAKAYKDNPEYVEVQLAAGGKISRKDIIRTIRAIIGLVALIFGYKIVKELRESFKTVPTETLVYGDHTEIKNFKEVMKLVPMEAITYSERREFSEKGISKFDEETGRFKLIKKFGNGVIEGINRTGIENRELDLEVWTEVSYVFDAEGSTCTVDRGEDGVVVYHIKVKRPEVKITNEKVTIHESHRELINLDKFDTFEYDAINTLKQEALDSASTPENIEKARKGLENYFLNYHFANGMATSDMIVYDYEPRRVEIEYLIEIENNVDNVHFEE